jgi:hypothetical protein
MAEIVTGVELGQRVRIFGEPRITVRDNARIICGDDVVLNSDPLGYHCGMPFPVTLIADKPDAAIVIGAGSRLHGCCVRGCRTSPRPSSSATTAGLASARSF